MIKHNLSEFSNIKREDIKSESAYYFDIINSLLIKLNLNKSKPKRFVKTLLKNNYNNEIKKFINQITDNNYETQTKLIIDCFGNIKDEIERKNIAFEILNTLRRNKFYSNVNSKIYKSLLNKYSIFNELLFEQIENYNEKFNSLVYISSSKNYEEFCNNNTIKDNLSAETLFYSHLCVYDVIKEYFFIDTIYFLYDKIEKERDDNNIYDYSENIYIIISTLYEKLKAMPRWDDINEILTQIINKKEPFNHIKTKCIFKFMDIRDFIVSKDTANKQK
jgi:hypothetical protein